MIDTLSSTPVGSPEPRPTWDIAQSFDWNAAHGPLIDDIPDEQPPEQPISFLSWQLRSPLGIAAGVLPNATFVEAYARLGYSLLTYKTVRSCAWNAYSKPVLTRLRPVDQLDPSSSTPLVVDHNELTYASLAELSSANSVGIPSLPPEQWREDVRRARESLKQGQVLIVNVVGTPTAHTGAEELANDYARCAYWAADAGADMIEVNLSCPNVNSGEGDVYLDPAQSLKVVKATRAAIGQIPLTAKLGYYVEQSRLQAVLTNIVPSLDALTLINSVKRPIVTPDGRPYFPGAGRECAGVGGNVIRVLAQETVRNAIEFLKDQGMSIPIIAIGGITQPHHVDEYLSLGATVAAVGTIAFWQPFFSHVYARTSRTNQNSMHS
jgi:dihydroorotate dehydrogenase (NAD+) catalytic subunit